MNKQPSPSGLAELPRPVPPIAIAASLAAPTRIWPDRGLPGARFHAYRLVLDALEQAQYARQPDRDSRLIQHSDHRFPETDEGLREFDSLPRAIRGRVMPFSSLSLGAA